MRYLSNCAESARPCFNATAFEEGGGEIRIEDVISPNGWWEGTEDESRADRFRDALEKMHGEVQLYINSPGGDVFAAGRMYSDLLDYKAKAGNKVIARVEALSASAASYLMMAADEIVLLPLSQLMIHRVSTVAVGNAEEMRQAQQSLEEADAGIAAVYAARTKKDSAEILKMMEDETWMSAESAIKNGFADRIAENGHAAEITAKKKHCKNTDTTNMKARLMLAATI